MLLRLRMVGLALVVAIMLAAPVFGASLSQTADEVVTLQAQSTITLTLTMKDGEIYQVPMVLDIETVQGQDTATVEITDVTVDHRNNYLVEVEHIGPVDAAVNPSGEADLMEVTQATVAPTPTPVSIQVVAVAVQTNAVNLVPILQSWVMLMLETNWRLSRRRQTATTGGWVVDCSGPGGRAAQCSTYHISNGSASPDDDADTNARTNSHTYPNQHTCADFES